MAASRSNQQRCLVRLADSQQWVKAQAYLPLAWLAADEPPAISLITLLKRYSAFIILPLLVALAYAPLDVPFTLDSVARILPVRQWVLTYGADGSLSAVMHDHRTGLLRRQEGYQFDRGDLVQLRFQDDWQSGKQVKAGETVATIASNRLGEQLIQLKNQLAIEQASLGVVNSGQKPQVIAQLTEEIKLAQDEAVARRKAVERALQLQAEGLIATLAVEQAEQAQREAEARVRLAEKTLAISASGEKQESVSLAAARIASLQKEIEFLETKRSKYVITAPFAGMVRVENSLAGNQLFVEDGKSLILQIPLRLRDTPYVQQGQQLQLELVEQGLAFAATVLEIGKRVEMLNYEQVVQLKVSTTEPLDYLSAGAALRCRLKFGKVRVAEYLRRSLRWTS